MSVLVRADDRDEDGVIVEMDGGLSEGKVRLMSVCLSFFIEGSKMRSDEMGAWSLIGWGEWIKMSQGRASERTYGDPALILKY